MKGFRRVAPYLLATSLVALCAPPSAEAGFRRKMPSETHTFDIRSQPRGWLSFQTLKGEADRIFSRYEDLVQALGEPRGRETLATIWGDLREDLGYPLREDQYASFGEEGTEGIFY